MIDCFANVLHLHSQFIVIKTKVKEIKGRKAYVEGRIEDMQGTLLVEAE